ncbi:MAG: hypothetical protein WD598_17735, partial [Acidimicrobiia bacterium]
VNTGDDIVCTFTNTTNTATVTVVKNIGSDTTPVAGWTFDGLLPGGSDPALFTANGTTSLLGQQTNNAVFAVDHVSNSGSPLTLTEIPVQADFSYGGVTCASGPNNVPVTTTVHGGTLNVNTGDNIVCTFVNNPAGIGLTKTPNPSAVTAGSNVTFTLVATNTSGVPLHNVIFTDDLDSAFTFVSSPDGCSAVGQLVTCGPYFPLPSTLDPGQTKTVSFVVAVGVGLPAGTVIPNTANVVGDPADGPPVTATAPASVSVVEVLTEVVTRPGSVAGVLPFTGSASEILVKTGLWLLGIGSVLVLLTSRRFRRRRAVGA